MSSEKAEQNSFELRAGVESSCRRNNLWKNQIWSKKSVQIVNNWGNKTRNLVTLFTNDLFNKKVVLILNEITLNKDQLLLQLQKLTKKTLIDSPRVFSYTFIDEFNEFIKLTYKES